MSEGGVGDSAPIGLTEMLKVLVEDRQRMEREHVKVRAEERRRHEEQMELMRRLVEELRWVTPEPTAGMAITPKQAKLTEQDDIEAYLTVFERMICAYKVERSWPHE